MARKWRVSALLLGLFHTSLTLTGD